MDGHAVMSLQHFNQLKGITYQVIEFSLNYINLVTSVIKAYIVKSKINLAKNITSGGD